MIKPQMILMLCVCWSLLSGCQNTKPAPSAPKVVTHTSEPSPTPAPLAQPAQQAPSARQAPAIAAPLGASQFDPLDEARVDQLLTLALDCVHREYPNVLLHALNSDADVQAPRQLHPAFFGCFDWHSSVHGHWLMARLAHLYPDAPAAPAAREALFISLRKAHIDSELRYLQAPGRQAFERPYGLAWLLQLDAELGDWSQTGEALADSLKRNLAPLVQQAREHLELWLPKLSHPVRSGTHGQTAFALGLMHDWAVVEQQLEFRQFVEQQAIRLYADDQACPLHYEPSGHDFFSACIAEADLMRRVLPSREFQEWLRAFLPEIPIGDPAGWLPVAAVTDRTDGHLAHLDGLNLSRAWMLEGIASVLDATDPRRQALLASAQQHSRAGMVSIENPHYAGGHWLGSFATYLVTQRGLSQQ